MPHADSPWEGHQPATWEKLETLVRAFTSALQQAPPPRIEDFLVVEGPARLALLADLVYAEPVQHRADRYADCGQRDAPQDNTCDDFDFLGQAHRVALLVTTLHTAAT